jgi:phosphorylcholine metabolism protein LicD
MAQIDRKIPQKFNQEILSEVCNELEKTNIRYFPFFGTLLGIIRDGNVICGDDDVDIYCPIQDEITVTEIMLEMGFDKSINDTPYFAQFSKQRLQYTLLVDFYFYIETDDKILDHWNFLGRPFDDEKIMAIPKQIMFPLQKIEFFGAKINIPSNPPAILFFLYGKDWRRKISKKRDYRMTIKNGSPRLVMLSKNERINLNIKYKFRALKNIIKKFL